jgi:CheY-like chemotaxis protein
MADLKTILHVDDDQDILEVTRMALTLVDSFDLHQCSSGLEAMRVIDSVNPDLLLLDVMMPDMTGPELWDVIKARGEQPHVPAIFMTAKAERQASDDLIGRGALEVVTKPFDPMTLGAQIRAAWEGKQP